MAAYNGEKYITEQLNSIENQTISPDEIIICNDASNDKTLNILEKFKSKSLIDYKIINNKKNLGYHKAFEKAISLASGDYIFISDQDDFWFKNKIYETIELFKKNINVNLIINNSVFTDENLKSQNISKISNFKKKFNNLNFYIPGCNCAFKKKLLKIYLPFPKIFISYDYWLNKISIVSNSRYINYNILQYYRRHNNNYSNSNVNDFKSKKIYYKSENNYYKLLKLNIYLKNKLINNNNNNINESLTFIKEENKSLIIRKKISENNFFVKLFFIIYMIKKNYYFKFHHGFKSLLKDLIR